MSAYDFSRLTQSQAELLTFAGWAIGCGRRQPGRSTVRKLVERGLLTEREVKSNVGPFTMTVPEYTVPIAVHIAWCSRCSELVGNDA